MNIFISGGCKNGKSSFAQDLAVRLANGGKLYYVATMIPCDDEDRERIARHLDNRAGLGFETLECGGNIMSLLEYAADRNGTFLVDSVTAMLLNEMFPNLHGGDADPGAANRCRDGILRFSQSVRNAIFVSDYIYSDAARYDDLTELYRRSLASIDRALAEACDTVIELCAGNIITHKGGLPV